MQPKTLQQSKPLQDISLRAPGKLLSRAALWAIWLVLVFGVLNIYGPSLWSYRPEGRHGTMTEREIAEAMTPLQTLGVILRNDTDTGRYLSYANAILGRPYGAYYVRPMRQWTTAERNDAGSNPSAMVTPDHPLLPCGISLSNIRRAC